MSDEIVFTTLSNPFQTRLVGDVKGPIDGSRDMHIANQFFMELEGLMEKYRIDKIDVCWTKFGNDS